MTGIDKTNLRTMATDIAKQLDRKDGEDNKIGASIWNEFVKDKGGKQIKHSITLENAIKSITTYLSNNAAKTGEAFGDLADKWFTAEADSVDKAPLTDGVEPVEKAEQSKEVESTNPVDKTPASDLPPQKLKIPDGIPMVKPIYEHTEEALDIIFCQPGRDINNQRKAGASIGKTLAEKLKNGSEQMIYSADKKNAAYVFLELKKQIPDLGKAWSLNAAFILEKLYNDLIERAEDLEIDILKESNLRTIDFDKANRYEKVTICEEISKVIQQHDQSAVNKLDMFESIKKPNPKLAYQTIKDKVTGKTYEYDGNGRIKVVVNKKGGADVYWWDDSIVLNLPTENGICQVSFDKNGALLKDYEEIVVTPNGKKYNVSRDENGKVTAVLSKNEKIFIHKDKTGSYYKDNRSCYYDKNGNLEYYCDEIDKSNMTTKIYRNKNGALIGSWERNQQSKTYKDADGNILARIEYERDKEGRVTAMYYKDADGNEITEEQFNELVDERLR